MNSKLFLVFLLLFLCIWWVSFYPPSSNQDTGKFDDDKAWMDKQASRQRFSTYTNLIKSRHTFVFYFSGHGMILRWVLFSASCSNSSSADVEGRVVRKIAFRETLIRHNYMDTDSQSDHVWRGVWLFLEIGNPLNLNDILHRVNIQKPKLVQQLGSKYNTWFKYFLINNSASLEDHWYGRRLHLIFS